MSSAARHPVGIDVSKATLDVCLLLPAHACAKRVANTAQGFTVLLAWVQSLAPGRLHVCLEATGTYHDALVAFLLSHGLDVSVLSSSRLPAFRKSEGKRSKTDAADALLLAQYCQQKQPGLFKPLPAEQEHLSMLMRRIDDLDQMAHQESNRRENSRLSEGVRAQIEAHRQQLQAWRKQTLEEAVSWVKAHDDLQQALELLQAQVGIGELTALRLLSLLGADGSRFANARQVVAFVGLDVVERQSGTSVQGRGHISKQGSGAIRKWLGMCALVAKRWDPDMRQWADDLAARGKGKKQIRVAVMRKLLHVAYGVLKHQQGYDPATAWPGHSHPQQERQQAA